MEKQKVNNYFNVIYFISIMLIIIGHIDDGNTRTIFGFDLLPIYSFHVVIFMFCSGYFFINNQKLTKLEIIKKKAKKILIPLFLWNLFYGIVITICHSFGFHFGDNLTLSSLFLKPLYDGEQFVFNLTSWYLFPLFMIFIIHTFIKNYLHNKKFLWIYFFICLSLSIFGIHLALLGYNRGFYMLLIRVLFFLPFFCFGLLYRNDLEEKDKMNNLLYFFIIAIIALIFTYLNSAPAFFYVSTFVNAQNIYCPIIFGFLGIFFILRISKILVKSFENSKFIHFISNNTMMIMIHHITGIFIVNTIFYFLSLHFVFEPHFDYNRFINEFFYLYFPKGLVQFKILYFISCFMFSILMIYIKKYFKKLFKRIIKFKHI